MLEKKKKAMDKQCLESKTNYSNLQNENNELKSKIVSILFNILIINHIQIIINNVIFFFRLQQLC